MEPQDTPRTPDAPAPAPGARVRNQREAGFTLLEILVVVAILGLLIGLVAPRALRLLSGARVSVAHQAIQRLASVLDVYKLDTGSYPSSEQGLTVLISRPSSGENWNGPYLQGDKVPLDPWNHAYMYREPSSRPGHDYDLCSGGPNSVSGEPGSEGMICNQ